MKYIVNFIFIFDSCLFLIDPMHIRKEGSAKHSMFISEIILENVTTSKEKI